VIEQSLGKNYSRFVNIFIFIFPIVIISLQVAGDLVLLILAMMGIFIAISQKLSPFIIKEIKFFSYLTFGYFIAVCLSVVFSGQAQEIAHYIPRDLYFFFAPFIALALFKADININYLLAGLKVGLIVLAMIVLQQLLFENYSMTDRPTGVMNSNVFGNLSVSLFFILLVFFQYESFRNKIITLFSLLSGLFIIIASGSRGAWISFIVLFCIYLYFLYKQKLNFSALSKIVAVIVIVCLLSAISINQRIFDRSFLIYSEISTWMSGSDAPTSVGLRLEIYKKAINNIEDVPFFGYGLRNSNIRLFQDDSSEMGIISFRYNHLHNAYLTNYYNGGIFLLATLLLILFVPLSIFLKENNQNRENPIFTAGAFLTLGYASYGMVNILFGDTYMNGFYVFFLALFLPLASKSRKIPST